MLLTAVLIPAPSGGYTALNPETGTTSQGESVEEALASLREATEVYVEAFPLMWTGQPLVTTFHVAVNAKLHKGPVPSRHRYTLDRAAAYSYGRDARWRR